MTDCPTCGRPLKAEQPEWTEPTDKPRRTYSVAIPKNEQASGYDTLNILIQHAGQDLHESLGYDSKVPPYYTLVAVLHDWLSTRVGHYDPAGDKIFDAEGNRLYVTARP